MKNFFKLVLVYGSAILLFCFLFYILYIKTDIGYSDSYLGYEPLHGPAWFESLLAVMFLPALLGFGIYDHFYPDEIN